MRGCEAPYDQLSAFRTGCLAFAIISRRHKLRVRRAELIAECGAAKHRTTSCQLSAPVASHSPSYRAGRKLRVRRAEVIAECGAAKQPYDQPSAFRTGCLAFAIISRRPQAAREARRADR